MLKWIASGCLVVVLIVCVVAYSGYRKMKTIAAAGPSVTVVIHASPERVYASMSHTDSLPAWLSPGMEMHTTRKGSIAAGDTIFLTSPRRDSTSRMAWIVDTVVPNQLITMRSVALQSRMVLYSRRDSIAAAGDSTRVTSTIATMLMNDSLAAARSRAGNVTGGLIDMASTMGTAGARIEAEQELRRLKAHIEGTPVSRP